MWDDEPGPDVILKCYSGKELLGWPAAALDVLTNVRRIYQDDSEIKAMSKLVVGNCHQENPKPTCIYGDCNVVIDKNAWILDTGTVWAVSHNVTKCTKWGLMGALQDDILFLTEEKLLKLTLTGWNKV